MQTIELDRTDLKILEELQRNARISNQDLAERVALSPSPCLRRVRRLEQAGVIQRYAAQVDPQALGLGLLAYVSVRLQKSTGQSHAPIEQFDRDVQRWTEVVACHAVTGDMDYLLWVQVADLAHFSKFAMDTLMRHPSVIDMRSAFVLKRVKG